MKKTLFALIATAALTVTAFSEQHMTVDTVMTNYDEETNPKVIAHVESLTGNGQSITRRFDRFDYTVTPTLLQNGSIDLAATLTEHYQNQKSRTIVLPKRNEASGNDFEFCIGLVKFSTRVSPRR